MSSGFLPNMSLLQKADLALSDLTAGPSGGGLLQPVSAQKFMRILIDEAKLMKMATVVPMKAMKMHVPKIRFGSRILRPGQEAVALSAADRAKPNLANIELDTKLFKAEVRIPNEVLEDNIEKEQLKDTIMQMMGEAISRDMEEVAILGDTTSPDNFLAQLDGVLKQVQSNVVDAGLATLNKNVLKAMIKSMPQVFRRNKDLLRFFTSLDAEIDYSDTVASRIGVVGDAALRTMGAETYGGIPIESIPLFPNDLGVGSNTSDVVLTDPKNITIGIWRDIRMETDKDISAGVVIIAASLRFDVKLAEETAAVKAYNVKVTA